MLTILQARMSSTRLPGKVLRDLAGAPMLARQIERVRRARLIGDLIVATSVDPSDDPLAMFCSAEGLACHRGPLDDVLGRFLGAIEAFGPTEEVVRLTGDCPLADPQVIDAVIERRRAQDADYVCNTLQLTFPKGLDVEAFKTDALQAAGRESDEPYDREHVTPFIYRRPERFRLANLSFGWSAGDQRWTVDTPADFAFVEKIYGALYPANPAFTSQDVFALTADWPTPGREG